MVIVTGDRNWHDYPPIEANLSRFWIGVLHEGGARGADRCAQNWAVIHQVLYETHRADWPREGRRAGPLRNIRMYGEASPDLVIAFKDNFGTNPRGGTEHMVSLALNGNTPVWLVGNGQAQWHPCSQP